MGDMCVFLLKSILRVTGVSSCTRQDAASALFRAVRQIEVFVQRPCQQTLDLVVTAAALVPDLVQFSHLTFRGITREQIGLMPRLRCRDSRAFGPRATDAFPL